MTQTDQKPLVSLHGLSDVEQRTVYVDYVLDRQILEIRRVLMNHVMNEEIHLAGFRYTVTGVGTDIKIRGFEQPHEYDGFTRTIYLKRS